MSWDAEDTETMKAMWNDGASASQIVRALGHRVTRSAVLGKVHRLGLGRDAPPVSRTPVIRDRTIKTKRKPPSMPAPMPEEKPPILRDNGLPVTLLDAGWRECRWPIGEVTAEMQVCGHQTEPGESWCAFHQRAGHQCGEAERIRRLADARSYEAAQQRKAERLFE